MPTSVAEQIAVEVKNRLDTISVANGFEHDPFSVIRPSKLTPAPATHLTIIQRQEDETENDELPCPGNPPAKTWNLPFVIAEVIDPSEQDDMPLDTFRNQFKADVMKALGDNESPTWQQWNGLALNSFVTTVTPYEDDDGSTAGYQLTLTVVYRTDEMNPFNLR